MFMQQLRSMIVPLVFSLFVIAAYGSLTADAADSEPIYFQNGAGINLCAMRGGKTSAGDNCITSADLVCWPVHTQEMRFHSSFGPAWWMIELPRPGSFARNPEAGNKGSHVETG